MHAHGIRCTPASRMHMPNGYITNWTFLVYMSELVHLVFFARTTSLFARLIFSSLFHFACFYFVLSIALWILLYSIFCRSFCSTVSCRSLTVECSLATILAKFPCVYVFYMLCAAFTFTIPLCEFCFTFWTRTHFAENCSTPVRCCFNYPHAKGERGIDSFIFFAALCSCQWTFYERLKHKRRRFFLYAIFKKHDIYIWVMVKTKLNSTQLN